MKWDWKVPAMLTLCLVSALKLDLRWARFEGQGTSLTGTRRDPSAHQLITEVNTLRESRGLAAYMENTVLMAIAQTQAEYMATSGVITHFGPDGTRPYQRAIAAGYLVAGDLSSGGLFAENIHAAPNLSAAEVVQIWQRDADHLNTMISPNLMDAGAGVASSKGLIYFVLDAGASGGALPTAATEASVLSTAAGTNAVLISTSTALPDGTVYHTVQPNEALWSIAQAYGLSISDLKRLNGLVSNNIFVGQKLLIHKIQPVTATLEPSITATFGIPTATSGTAVARSTGTATPTPSAPTSFSGGGRIVLGIVALAAIAAALGSWLGRKKSSAD